MYQDNRFHPVAHIIFAWQQEAYLLLSNKTLHQLPVLTYPNPRMRTINYKVTMQNVSLLTSGACTSKYTISNSDCENTPTHHMTEET